MGHGFHGYVSHNQRVYVSFYPYGISSIFAGRRSLAQGYS